jgi:hypothetical protein
MNALAGILPNRPESYVIYKGDEVEDETITFRTVANDLRKVVENILMQDLPALQTVWPTEADLQNSPTGPANSPGNQFGPTFTEAEPADAGPQNSHKISMNKQRKKGIKKSRKEDAEFRPKRTASHMLQGNSEDVRETSCVCRACEGFHSTRRYFYLFPDSRLRSWKANKRRQTIVDKNLKENSTLAEEVKQWEKKRMVIKINLNDS